MNELCDVGQFVALTLFLKFCDLVREFSVTIAMTILDELECISHLWLLHGHSQRQLPEKDDAHGDIAEYSP
jgi:hypothetical protein